MIQVTSGMKVSAAQLLVAILAVTCVYLYSEVRELQQAQACPEKP